MPLRGWLNLIKTLFITLAPIYISAILIWCFGFRLESILASILFVQIYVMIIQAEAMLRQAAWSKAAYDAIFRVSADVRGKGTAIEVANCGQTPAYNFFIGLKDETKGDTLGYEEITLYGGEFGKSEGRTLSSGRERHFLVQIPEEEFRKRRIVLRVMYNNVLGDLREIQAVSFEGSEEFFMMPSPVEPGFLVKAYQDLMLFTQWHFRYKKLARKKPSHLRDGKD